MANIVQCEALLCVSLGHAWLVFNLIVSLVRTLSMREVGSNQQNESLALRYHVVPPED